jgi:hypothetical protein
VPRRRKTTTSSSKKNSTLNDPRCLHCGRSLLGYSWNFEDGQDGYICTATHPETGGNVAFFKFALDGDEWTLVARDKE